MSTDSSFQLSYMRGLKGIFQLATKKPSISETIIYLGEPAMTEMCNVSCVIPESPWHHVRPR